MASSGTAKDQNLFRVDPIYTKMTTPRGTKDGRAALPSVMDMFGELAMTSQYKVSLHLGDSGTGGKTADNNVTDWLISCGVLGNFNSNVPNENLSSLRYEFMCDGAALPGYELGRSTEQGGRQGIQEQFVNMRTFTPVNLSFYVGADYGILRLWQEWANFITPLSLGSRDVSGSSSGQLKRVNRNDFMQFRYPDSYKREISITKFERSVHVDGGYVNATPNMITYRLIDAYPLSVDNIRLGYENSDIMRVSVTLAYTRYITLDHAGTGNSQNPFNAPKPNAAFDPVSNQQVLVSPAPELFAGSTLLNNNFYNAFNGLDVDLGTGANDLSGSSSTIA